MAPVGEGRYTSALEWLSVAFLLRLSANLDTGASTRSRILAGASTRSRILVMASTTTTPRRHPPNHPLHPRPHLHYRALLLPSATTVGGRSVHCSFACVPNSAIGPGFAHLAAVICCLSRSMASASTMLQYNTQPRTPQTAASAALARLRRQVCPNYSCHSPCVFAASTTSRVTGTRTNPASPPSLVVFCVESWPTHHVTSSTSTRYLVPG